jgi:transposase-like protein
LPEWVKKAEVDSGKRAGVPTDMAEKLMALERENRELRQANEILRKAPAYFAQAAVPGVPSWRRCRAAVFQAPKIEKVERAPGKKSTQ